jgi:hypothetical protein
MPAPTLQFKRGLVANLPGLKAGEPGFTTDFFELYVGIDSTTTNNKFFGSHRYWTKGTSSTGSGVNFVEGTNNGSQYITLKAADTLAGITTFTLPSADGSAGQVLSTNGSGILSFSTLAASSFTISDGTSTDSVGLGQTLTFAGTANEIQTAVTDNQVQIGLPDAVSVTTSLVVGSGVTINASGINAAAGIITASRFVSNVLDGTAPISVASSTRVDNLNAQYVGGFGAPTSQVIGATDTQTLTNKTIALGSNTISGTLAQFNTALTDADFVSIAGTETLTNKTLLVGTATSTGTASQPLQVEGGAYVSGTLGIGTTNPDQTFKLVVNGSANFIGSVTSSTGFFVNGNLVGGEISGTNLVGTALSVSGISTFSGGPVLIGGGTSTGTVGQVLQVAGINSSVYIGGNLGVGVTNPQATLQVGTAISMYGATGIVSATTFVGALTGTASSTTNIPNLTGAITSNNTTTSLGSFSSSDLASALTDETGSGSAVFATSPTLVTPSLGIASAISLNVSGIVTASEGARFDGVQIGINGANVIDTVSGNLTLNSAGGTTIIDDLVTIQNNLVVNGNVTIGGTTVTLRGTDVFIENKDIILGFTTSVTPNDDTANHAGVAIASTVGSPLVSFTASGINTLPDTYKQMMWFKSGTLGFSTDVFGFNYGVAIGTTTVANGVRLAVGSGITMTDTEVSATTFRGALSGTATSTTNIPNLTGAITSNNTTTSLGSFSSSNLATALTDKTGTGVAVFATSPTLVTPALGDATATTIVTSGAVNVGTALSAPTVKTATIQHSNATNAATIDASGNITAAQNLTVSGDLFVNGSTTQVNTAALTVEDRTIDLGIVNGAAPGAPTTWDLGILFNYHATTAKKSAVIWEHTDSRFKFASVLATDSDGTTVNTPDLTVTTFAPIEIASLWVNDCAGSSQVISCTGTERFLENITIDAGEFV